MMSFRIFKFLSSMAIFVSFCSVIAIVISLMWWFLPICDESCMLIGRWIISGIITSLLIATRKLIIN